MVAGHACISTPKSRATPVAAKSKPLSAPARPLWGQRFGSRLRTARGLTPQPQRKPTQLPRLIAIRSCGPHSRRCLTAVLAGRSALIRRIHGLAQPLGSRSRAAASVASHPVRSATPAGMSAVTSHSALSRGRSVATLPLVHRKCSEMCVRPLCRRVRSSARNAQASGYARVPRPRPRTSFAACPRRFTPAGRVSSVLRVASRRVASPAARWACVAAKCAASRKRPHGTVRRSLRLRGAPASRRVRRVRFASRQGGRRRSASRCGGWLGPQSPPRHAGAKCAPARGVKRRPARAHP